MKDLAIHKLTKTSLDNFLAQPSHAVMLTGAQGSGKFSLATYLVEQTLGIKEGTFVDFAYGKILRPNDGKAIGIDAIRELDHFLSLKVPSQKIFDRAVIIEDSHFLTLEAQNALLKMLEEPPQGTLFILTASYSQSLLPTIRSRTQIIDITRPELQHLKDFFKAQGHDETAIKTAVAISGGLPGLMHAILSQEDHPLIAATERTRLLLSQPAYDRLLSVDELSKQKQLARDITFILKQMAHISLLTAKGSSAKKWQVILNASYEAGENLSKNGQAKLALTKLMLSL